MKTLRYLSTTAFVVSLAMFASCSSDNDIETNNENNTNNGNTNSEKLVFSASIVPNEVTRATLNEDDKTLHWEANDQIAVFSPINDTKLQFDIDNKYAGETIAYFTSTMSGLSDPTNFSGNPYYFAFYPYSAVSKIAQVSTSVGYNRVSVNLPSEQKVTAQDLANGITYDKSAMLMMARATPSEKAFEFKNVNALLKVTISNNADGDVKYIKVFSNNSSKLMSGTLQAFINNDGITTTYTSGQDLAPQNYVQLEIPASPNNDPIDYYISVFQDQHATGFTLLLESEFDADRGSQYIYQRRYTGDITFNKSVIYNMGTYDVSSLTFLDNVVDLGLPSATIWTTKNLEDGDNGKAKFVDNMYSYGGYYSWGETRTKDTNKYNQSNYALYNRSDVYSSNVLLTNYDVAYQMNSVYRMPSYTQFTELLNAGFTKTNTLSGSGNRGIKFTNSKGRYIWFPAGGCNYGAGGLFSASASSSVHDAGTIAQYWSRSVKHPDSDQNSEIYASCFDIDRNGEYAHGVLSGTGPGYDRRFAGKSIRPVLYK